MKRKQRVLNRLSTIACLLVLLFNLNAQNKTDQVYVDDNGVMRWSADHSELHGFGVNYTLPFAHEYRMALKSGFSHEEIIRQDVYHMARLDFDLYRVHVWDTEISDTLGNLINNIHLRLFDFMVNEMKQRGMRFIITPIAYWGNGWPEPDEPTPGFSRKYGKAACLTNPVAIEAQANYLNQLLDHVNAYTGVAYKDDPSVIGFEISNEPHHGEAPEKVTAFINKMTASMRRTGCTKPIFYNMSHSIHLAGAYLDADIEGGTFQWYPTGLVANRQINGNFLPHVESYSIPFAALPKFKKMAKIVYEFDAADVGSNIMYPAMALAFRKAGMQLAAHFAYDAQFNAHYNTNYGTHFMNLAYAPQRAISLKIASAVFHNIIMYGNHNGNTGCDALRISYNDDLAEWIKDGKFFYTNNTASQPASFSQLKEIAGYGSSPLINYSGTGAYFLDKISDGIWRLEVMPDAYWIDDPYSPVDPNRQKAAVIHSTQQMTVSLPDLDADFSVSPVNKGNTFRPQVSNSQFDLIPGVYLLKRKGIASEIHSDLRYKNIRIDEFVAPPSNLSKTVLWNYSPVEAVTGKPLDLHFEAVTASPVEKVEVALSAGNRWRTVTAVPCDKNSYKVEVPGDMLETGFLNYRVTVENGNNTTTFPGGKTGDPRSWENRNDAFYTIRIVPEKSPLVLWDAETDWEPTFKIWNRAIDLKPTVDGETALSIRLEQLPKPDPVDTSHRCYAFKFFFGDKIKGRSDELLQKKVLAVKASNRLSSPQPLEIGLVDKNGSVIAGKTTLTPGDTVIRIPVNSFTDASFLVLPRPFPDFLPFKVRAGDQPFDRAAVETLQVVVKPGKLTKVDLLIEKIWLE